MQKPTQNKVICFHGTDGGDAAHIMTEGFGEGTFFAKHLEDALEFGGMWVFQVCFDDELPPGCWQFRITERKSHTDIVALIHYAEIQEIYNNSDLRESIFDSGVG